jgi:uncharacterized membrane protein HdeD (DUF308 family)
MSKIKNRCKIFVNTRLSQIWWVFLLQGLAGIILGFFLLTEPAATLVALTTLLGFYWLVHGALSLVQVFVDRSIPWIRSLLTDIVGILAGMFVPRHPLVAALTVPMLIVIILGVQGLTTSI